MLLAPAGMPCELVQHFSPASPLLVGGVLPAEEGSGHLQLRLKRHRWFPRILKTRDPLVFSIGAHGTVCLAVQAGQHLAQQSVYFAPT